MIQTLHKKFDFLLGFTQPFHLVFVYLSISQTTKNVVITMKTVATAILALALQAVAIAQDSSVDPRLEANIGAEAITLKENNPDYYNFLIYELNESYFVTSETPDPGVKQEVYSISRIKDAEGNEFNESVLENSETFNFKAYNFKRTHDNRVLYELSDGRYLVFYTLKEVKENYKKK